MQSKWSTLILLTAVLLGSGCKSGAASTAAPSSAPTAPPPLALPAVAAVPRDTPWTLPLPADLPADEVAGVTVQQGDQSVPVTVARQNQQWVITPARPYARNSAYTVRIYAAGDKRYEGTFTTQPYVKLEPGQIYLMEAVPDQGFHFGYFLYIPPGVKAGAGYRLLVETNDSGSASDNTEYQIRQARRVLEPTAPARVLGNTLSLPVLVPILPWPVDPPHLCIQGLSRATLQTKDDKLTRIDLQMAAMIKDAGQWLAANGIQTENRVFLDGYATSGLLADRFALLHPDLVQAVAFGGTAGVITLPASSYQGQKLCYPLGMADLDALTGSAVSPEAAARVARFAYLQSGEPKDILNTQDTFPLAADAFAPAEADLIRSLFGAQVPDRWAKMQQAARDLGLNVQFATYTGAGHSDDAVTATAEFFRAHMRDAEGGTAK